MEDVPMHGALRAGFLAAMLLAGRPALAVDIEATQPPAPVTDGQLSIGPRSLQLPPGEWTYIGRSERNMTMFGVDRIGTSYTAYAMDARGGRMHAGLVLAMSRTSVPARSWREEPCKVTGELHKDTFDSSYAFPECLLVFKRRSHLTQASEGFFGQARQWADERGIRRGAVYEIAYSKYGTSDFGVVRLFVPVAIFPGDAQAIAWARELPSALSRMLEGNSERATLPALPAAPATKDPKP